MIRKVIAIILVILWSMLIFSFSSDNGNESASLSDRVTTKIYEIINVKPSKNAFHTTAHFVRKTAHFTEYLILGILIINLLVTFNVNKRVIILSIIFAVLYAVSDEVHQLFVDGRSGNNVDVCIDSFGAITGIWLYNLIRRKHEKTN